MNKIILFIATCCFCISIFYLDAIAKVYAVSGNGFSASMHLQHLSTDVPGKKGQGKEAGKDLLVISGKDGRTATCSFLDDKKFHCNKTDNPRLYMSFIKRYFGVNKRAMQYAYFLDDTGKLLIECKFNIKKVNYNEDISNCQARKDINLPVKMLSGKVLSTANKLLLIGENSEIYQCSYDSANKISGCYSIGMKNMAATDVMFDPVMNKVYFYSDSANKLYSCNFIYDSDSIENCLPVSLNTGFPDENIQHVTMVPDNRHILLSEKNTLHYCNIDNKKSELSHCVSVYKKFSNLTSLTYSKNNDKLLYVIDDNMIKACYFDDTDVYCHKMELNNDIREMSLGKISSATVFTFVSIRVDNKGGYRLKASYTTQLNSNMGINIREKKSLALDDRKYILAKGGSGVELQAVGGNTKCFMVDMPGRMYCSRGTLNMACYYNNLSSSIINGSCPSSLEKNSCTPEAILHMKTSGNAALTCGKWMVNYKENKITTICKTDYLKSHVYDVENTLSCYTALQALRYNKKVFNRHGHLVIAWGNQIL